MKQETLDKKIKLNLCFLSFESSCAVLFVRILAAQPESYMAGSMAKALTLGPMGGREGVIHFIL